MELQNYYIITLNFAQLQKVVGGERSEPLKVAGAQQ
jgi:hypothetical protein